MAVPPIEKEYDREEILARNREKYNSIPVI
jgi:hypothetical protein